MKATAEEDEGIVSSLMPGPAGRVQGESSTLQIAASSQDERVRERRNEKC